MPTEMCGCIIRCPHCELSALAETQVSDALWQRAVVRLVLFIDDIRTMTMKHEVGAQADLDLSVSKGTVLNSFVQSAS